MTHTWHDIGFIDIYIYIIHQTYSMTQYTEHLKLIKAYNNLRVWVM